MGRPSNAEVALREQVPEYRLLAPCFLEDETWRPAGDIIEYWGSPNEHMEALNEAAEVKLQEYLNSLDDGAQARAEFEGRKYRPRMRDLGDQVAEAVASRPKEQNVVMPKYNDSIPIRPDMVPISKRGGRKAKLVVSARTPKPKVKASAIPTAVQGSHYTQDAANEGGIS